MKTLRIGETEVEAGEKRTIGLTVSQSSSGVAVKAPVTVWRSRSPGPTVFVTAAIHGDELNGTGIIRELIMRPPFELRRGSLVLVPVVNILGFERHMRYLPDRRDLNRCFPGSKDGSLASRIARTIFKAIVSQCDYGIDLHTAAVRRTNYPNIRADMTHADVARMARAFGTELIINKKGPQGSLRRAATEQGCPTIVLEAGEVWKIEPTVLASGMRGVQNVLIELEMIDADRTRPPYQAVAEKTTWVRADFGGILEFHVAPGQIVDKGAALATNTSLSGGDQNVLESPAAGVVLGLTTIPAVTPGDAVCHLACPRGGVRPIRRALADAPQRSVYTRLRDDLATSFTVSEEGNPDSRDPSRRA